MALALYPLFGTHIAPIFKAHEAGRASGVFKMQRFSLSCFPSLPLSYLRHALHSEKQVPGRRRPATCLALFFIDKPAMSVMPQVLCVQFDLVEVGFLIAARNHYNACPRCRPRFPVVANCTSKLSAVLTALVRAARCSRSRHRCFSCLVRIPSVR